MGACRTGLVGKKQLGVNDGTRATQCQMVGIAARGWKEEALCCRSWIELNVVEWSGYEVEWAEERSVDEEEGRAPDLRLRPPVVGVGGQGQPLPAR